jgi:hypothetical protein
MMTQETRLLSCIETITGIIDVVMCNIILFALNLNSSQLFLQLTQEIRPYRYGSRFLEIFKNQQANNSHISGILKNLDIRMGRFRKYKG